MFRKKSIAVIIIIIGFIALPFQGMAQQTKGSVAENKEQALKDFEEGNYQASYEGFMALLKKYPKDGIFHYYSGMSLYYQNKNLNEAIEHLEYASGKSRVPSDVFYFLGQAYRKEYRFPESKKAFNRYNSVATRSEQKERIPSREAEMSSNAMNTTLEYNPFEILATSLFNFSDSTIINQVRGKGGILNPKPNELYLREEDNNELSSFVFLPREIQKGDYVYFSDYGKSRKKGLELFRVKKNGGKNWGTPVALDELNTESDEIMPYFDPVSKDLYFASRGHHSMGGYDVFKSHYDEERDSWSDPVSLGFPVNSPMNEYLAMPGYDLGTILVITDRQGLNNSMTVYKLKLSEPKKSLSSASATELQKIGNLGGIAAIPSIVDLQKEEIVPEEVSKNNLNKENPPEKPGIINDPHKLTVKTALQYQQKADSLTRLAKASRVKVRTLPDPDDRWAYQRQIIEWEKLARDYQELADKSYTAIESASEETPVRYPETIQPAKKINNIQVYEYSDQVVAKETGTSPANSSKPISATVQEKFKTSDEPGEVIQNPVKNNHVVNRFVILDSSPYNANNPFPVNVKLPEGAFYRIQLGVFSKKLDYNNFGGISPITAETVSGKNLTRYFAGKFGRYNDAVIALSKVKQQGFKDAYIIGWYNGERMALNRIREFEERDAR